MNKSCFVPAKSILVLNVGAIGFNAVSLLPIKIEYPITTNKKCILVCRIFYEDFLVDFIEIPTPNDQKFLITKKALKFNKKKLKNHYLTAGRVTS